MSFDARFTIQHLPLDTDKVGYVVSNEERSTRPNSRYCEIFLKRMFSFCCYSQAKQPDSLSLDVDFVKLRVLVVHDKNTCHRLYAGPPHRRIVVE